MASSALVKCNRLKGSPNKFVESFYEINSIQFEFMSLTISIQAVINGNHDFTASAADNTANSSNTEKYQGFAGCS